MGRRWIVGVLVGCGLAAIVVAAAWPRKPEPEYNGRTLSEWLLVLSANAGEAERGTEAFERDGASGLAALVACVGYRGRAWCDGVEKFWPCVPQWVKRHHPVSGITRGLAAERSRAEGIALAATEVLWRLGPKATPAIPALARLAPYGGG